MSRVLAKPALVAGFAVLLALAPGIASGAAQSPAVETTQAARAALAAATPISDFGACIAGGGVADVLLLVDESSSLLTSDADLSRVTSATYFVDQLAGYADKGGLAVDVQLSVFGDSYGTLLTWTNLNIASIDSVHAGINSLATRTGGFDTDYWTALNGARNDLAARAANRPTETSCQAIVWFTDGKLDYFARTDSSERDEYGTAKVFAPGVELTSKAAADQVKQAASTDLCRDGGIADQLRSSGVRMFGVLLNGSTSVPSDFDFVESVIAGQSESGGQTCGKLQDPAPGEFHRAVDIDSMLFAFDAFGSPGNAPITQSTGICQVAGCGDQVHPFVLDASTPDFHVLATADITGLEASLTPPDGEVITFPHVSPGVATELHAGGASLSYTWESEKTVSVNVSQADSPDESWSGLWRLAFTDPTGTSPDKKSYSSIHISGSLRPALSSGNDLEYHTGEVVSGLTLGLVNKDDRLVDPASILGTLTYSAFLEDSSGTRTRLLDAGDAEELAGVTSIDLAEAAIGPALLSLSVAITTASFTDAAGVVTPGTVLEPATIAIPLTILPPLDYPVVASGLDFGRATGEVSLSGVLPVTGDGCVWIEEDSPAQIEASPADLGTIAVTAADATTRETCFQAGTAEGLTVTLVTEAAGNGSINGSVPVMISPAGASGDPLEVTVNFTASLQKPLNATNFWITLLTALVLGPGIPLLILYFAKWLVSKVPARALAGTLIEVTVDHGQVLRQGARFTLGPADVQRSIAIDARGARRLEVEGVGLRTKLGWAPGGAGYVTVEAPGRLSASSTDRSTARSGKTAVLPLAVHNHWVVLHTPGAGSAASVLVLIAGDASPAQKSAMEDDINRRLPGFLASLVSSEAEADSGSTGPFGSAAPRQSPPSFTGSFNASPSAQAQSPATPSVPSAPSQPEPPRFGFGRDPETGSESGTEPSRWGTR